MVHDFEALPRGSRRECIHLYDGIELSYVDIVSDALPHRHEALSHIMQVNYCRAGQAAWSMRHGSSVFLNPGDFSVHTLDVCTDSLFQFPTGQYRGLTVSVDLREVAAQPLLAEAGISGELLREKFCLDGAVAFLEGNEQTGSIFSGFYGQPENLRLPYQRLKVLELLLYLAGTEYQKQLAEYPAEQLEVIREIHDQLLRHMERRVTIEELSRQYLINPTTLKAAFKAVYGASLASHIKQHRMEQAARLLRETDMSVAAIAQAVGYESQSKFSAAFKESFQVLPREYRKRLSGG